MQSTRVKRAVLIATFCSDNSDFLNTKSSSVSICSGVWTNRRSQDDGGSVSAGDVRGEALHLLHCTSLTLRQSQSATKRGNYLLSSELTEILCQSTMYNVESIL